MSFAKEVWDTLSKIDVSNHVEKKMNLSYLSWAWAWGELMKYYPESQYQINEPKIYSNNTCEVSVTLVVKNGEHSTTRDMWLPVMDHRNKAIVNPDSRAISDSRMRCLVKCIAMFGLGHYIYAGEDLPDSKTSGSPKDHTGEGLGLTAVNTEQLDVLTNLYQQEDFMGLWRMREQLGRVKWTALKRSLASRFGDANKSEGIEQLDKLLLKAENKISCYATEFKKFINSEDMIGIEEIDELPGRIKKVLYESLTDEEGKKLNELKGKL